MLLTWGGPTESCPGVTGGSPAVVGSAKDERPLASRVVPTDVAVPTAAVAADVVEVDDDDEAGGVVGVALGLEDVCAGGVTDTPTPADADRAESSRTARGGPIAVIAASGAPSTTWAGRTAGGFTRRKFCGHSLILRPNTWCTCRQNEIS